MEQSLVLGKNDMNNNEIVSAMKQALEALESAVDQLAKPYSTQVQYAITSLRQAIAEAEKQEPEKYALDIECERCGAKQSGVLTVHTHPQPKREPLTDAELDALCPTYDDPMRREMWKIGYKAAHGIKGEA